MEGIWTVKTRFPSPSSLSTGAAQPQVFCSSYFTMTCNKQRRISSSCLLGLLARGRWTHPLPSLCKLRSRQRILANSAKQLEEGGECKTSRGDSKPNFMIMFAWQAQSDIEQIFQQTSNAITSMRPQRHDAPITCRRPPDYSSTLCLPKTFTIWRSRGCFGPFTQEKTGRKPKTAAKKSYSKCFRQTQIRWVIWRSSNMLWAPCAQATLIPCECWSS